MQLKNQLSLAVGALLSATAHITSAASQPSESDWLIDASVLSYSEQDSQGQDRISVFKPVIQLTKQKSIDDYYRFRFVFDSLSGASPNGGFASSQPQTFSSASGGTTTSPSANGTYTTPAGKTPLDPNFKDTRIALGYSRMKPLARLVRAQYGIDFSTEADYSSLSVNYTLMQDTQSRQTTFSFGGAYSYDTVNPTNGFKTELSWMPKPTSTQVAIAQDDEYEDDDDDELDLNFTLFSGEPKHTVDFLLGLTHVLNRYTLLQANYTISYSSGYLTDPYKIVPVIDPNTGLPTANNPPDTFPYIYEKRPSNRLKQAVKLTGITSIGKDSLHLSYRYYWDDWGIEAHTGDLKYHLALGNHIYIEPHYRYSIQSEADFYVLSLNDNEPFPTYASSDIRLAAMVTETYGAMLGVRISADTTFTLNLEQMTQRGDSHPDSAVGDQKLNDMFPTITATMVTLGVRTRY